MSSTFRRGALVPAGLAAALAVVAVVAIAISSLGESRTEASKAEPATTTDPLTAQLTQAKDATARFQTASAAIEAGYVAAPACVQSPAGAMGFHYSSTALMDGELDIDTPEILLYLPDSQGVPQLIGLEYWKADADQDLATDDDRPSLSGQAFDGPMEGHSPGQPRHYDLHVWVWYDNPSGMFAQYNPTLRCPS
jgi:hypothetical protein